MTTEDVGARPEGLAALFRPRGVAVLGASRAAGSIGQAIVRNLIDGGFTGPVFPVNPSARAVCSVPCYPAIEDVPGPVDLAVVAVPAPAVPDVVRRCGARGVGAVVVVSAGFREAGGEGVAREDALRAAAAAHGVRVVGPNCMGVLSTDPEVRLDASFAAVRARPGGVAFASQSGALGEALLARAAELDLGLSAFVSLGNRADVGPADLLAWWEDDPRTRVVLLYLEGLGDPRAFARAAARVARAGKPVLAVKSGRTAAGARASASHTGALAGGDEATTTLLEQCGVLRVTRVEGLFNLARAFARQPVPRGPRVAIVSNAGGPGIMAADAATAYGLEVPPLAPATQAALRAALVPGASVVNPVDAIATASAEAMGRAVELALADPGVDALLAIYVGPSVMDVRAVAGALVAGVDRARGAAEAPGPGAGKPVLVCFMGGRVDEARQVLRAAGIPAYDFPEDAAQALGAMARYRAWLELPEDAPASPAPDLAARAAAALGDHPPGWLPSEVAFALLDAAGVPTVPRAWTAAGASPEAAADEAVAAAARLGWPVVLKLEHPDLLHKTDVGAVRLGLADEGALRAALADVRRRAAAVGLDPARARWLVQAQAARGRELLLGARRDAAVGPVVAVGQGGTEAEVQRDVALGVPPLGPRAVERMLASLRMAPLLHGHRGAPAVDEPALVDAVLRLAALLEACPDLDELEVNPLVATPAGVLALDARAARRRAAALA